MAPARARPGVETQTLSCAQTPGTQRDGCKEKRAHTPHTHTMFAKEPPEGYMAQCREEWLRSRREEQEEAPPSATPSDQPPPHSPAQRDGSSSSSSSSTPWVHADSPPDRIQRSSAASPWEHAGNPLLSGCARPRCRTCRIILKTGELACPCCPDRAPSESPGSSGSDDQPRQQQLASEQDSAALRRKRRQAQMRLISLRRGDIKPRPGEPQCLEILVAELGAVLRQPRGADGKFAARGGAEDAPQAV